MKTLIAVVACVVLSGCNATMVQQMFQDPEFLQGLQRIGEARQQQIYQMQQMRPSLGVQCTTRQYGNTLQTNCF